MSQRIAKRVLLLDRRLVRQPSTGKDKRYWRALPAERALGVSGSRVPTGVGNRWGQRGRPQRQYLLGKPAIGGQKMPRHGQKPDAPGQMTFFGRRQGEVPCTGKPQKPIGVRERLRPPTERSPGKETVIFLPPFSWRGA